ncbi:MAG: pentapeptide repeat-containing protein [Desulfobacterales bacterium]|jgi:uncharacterized protein YjbI with pentapeptide repeats
MFVERDRDRFGESPNEILIRCLEKGDLAEWDEWRDNNKRRPISLRGARLGNVNLAHADLSQVDLKMAYLEYANLAGADLSEANLAGANLSHANLVGANLWKADLKFASLRQANLKSTKLEKANLQNAKLIRINLESADLWKANLKGTKFISVIVDRRTFIWGCDFDEQTVFIGGQLSKARIEPRLIEHLIKNIQRIKV